MKKLTIQTITRKMIKTKYGDKEKMSVKFAEKPELLVDVWVAGWSGGWQEGMEVEIEDDQWQEREYQGKTYWTIKAPASARFGISREEFDDLKARVTAIEGNSLKEIQVEGTLEELEEQKQEEKEEIKPESDIPF